MNNNVPYKINEIKLTNMCYTNMKSNTKKTIQYIKYNDDSKVKNFIFQTPTLLNINNIIIKNNLVTELDIPLSGKSFNKINKFEKLLNDLDTKIIKDSTSNPKWFTAFHHIKEMKYHKILRDHNGKDILRLKILKTNNFETKILLNNNKIKNNEIPKNSWIKILLEIYAIWINETGFGLFIRPILIDIKTIQHNIYNYKIIEDDSEDFEDMDDILDTIQDNISFDNLFIKSETIDSTKGSETIVSTKSKDVRKPRVSRNSTESSVSTKSKDVRKPRVSRNSTESSVSTKSKDVRKPRVSTNGSETNITNLSSTYIEQNIMYSNTSD